MVYKQFSLEYLPIYVRQIFEWKISNMLFVVHVVFYKPQSLFYFYTARTKKLIKSFFKNISQIYAQNWRSSWRVWEHVAFSQLFSAAFVPVFFICSDMLTKIFWIVCLLLSIAQPLNYVQTKILIMYVFKATNV